MIAHPNMQVARTILSQLGGNKFIAMTGAKNFIGAADSLSFKVGRNDKGVTHVHVKLDGSDTYTMTFTNLRGTRSAKVIATQSGVYFDQLQAIFTDKTGLLTRL